jgi:hypothetical protein
MGRQDNKGGNGWRRAFSGGISLSGLGNVTNGKIVYLINRNGKAVGIFCGDETQ